VIGMSDSLMPYEQIILMGQNRLRDAIRFFQITESSNEQIEDWVDEALFDCGVRGDSDD